MTDTITEHVKAYKELLKNGGVNSLPDALPESLEGKVEFAIVAQLFGMERDRKFRAALLLFGSSLVLVAVALAGLAIEHAQRFQGGATMEALGIGGAVFGLIAALGGLFRLVL